MKDFTPTAETISLHGLGFIQLKLDGNQRLHVWHPELPRRDCFEHSAVHNHRFGFTSRVLKGTQVNQRVDLEFVKTGTHNLISHNGPRAETGGRASFHCAEVNLYPRIKERFFPGEEYTMPMHEYHHTPCEGIVITLMRKLQPESAIHANSVCRKGVEFHAAFDRFQLSPTELFAFVTDAFQHGN